MIFTKHILKFVSLIFIFGIMATIVIGQNEKVVTVDGKIFGRSLKDLVELQGIPNQQNFFIEVLKSNNNENIPRFIKVRNVYKSKNKKLTDKFFNIKKTWVFILERDCSCDEEIKDWKDTKEVLLYKDYDELHQQNFIQCFVLKQKPDLVDEK